MVSDDAFLAVADLLPEATLLVAADGRIVCANKAAAALLGVAAEDLRGRALAEWSAEGSEAIRALLRACSRSRQAVPGALTLIDGQGRSIAYRSEGAVFRPRTGSEPALVMLRLIRKADAVERFIALNERIEALTREVGRRRRAEQAVHEQREWLRVTLASIGDAVIATDVAGRVTFLNGVAERLTGWSVQGALGRRLDEVFDIVDETSGARIESPVSSVLRDGVVVGLADRTVLVARDGVERRIDDSGAPIRDDQGNLLGVVLVFRDTSERRALERELERQRAALIESNRRKDEFLAMLGHELRNPLAPLLTSAQMLSSFAPDKAVVQQIGAIMERQLRHLTRLVEDLLDVSRVTGGRIKLQKQTVALRTPLEGAVEMVRPLIEQQQHALTVTLPPPTLMVEADPTRLVQVVANLLTNAAKFTPPGGEIVLAGALEDGRATILVRDNGIGIAPALLPQVFELFVQGDQSLDRKQGGLGIGLTIVRALVELHGGTVEARSDGVGQGSTFVVRLPAVQGMSASSEGDRTTSAPAHGAASSQRILVVDDNADAAESLAVMLRLKGYEVRTAGNGADALDLLEAFRPHVVFLDIGLPGMDGYEVARRIRSEPALRDAVLVAVTGYGEESDQRRAREAGFDQHLIKPVHFARVQALLGELALSNRE